MFSEKFRRRLEVKKENGLYRDPVRIESRDGKFVTIGGRRVLSFASNDYLGISCDERLREIVSRNFRKYSTSSSSSRLVSGNYSAIRKAEEAYASYFGFEDCLFFPSGYQTNLGVLSSLFDSSDTVFFDKHIHASAVKGLSMSGAKIVGFKHNSFEHLEKRLKKNGNENSAIVTESLFSMDGDIPDMKKLKELKERFSLLTIVDESHAFGVLGEKGKGAAMGVSDISVGTFGKALGFFGAFVLLPSLVKEYLFNHSSPLIYSTTLPEAHGASAMEFLGVIEDCDDKRKNLKDISHFLRDRLLEEGFQVSGDAHILSVLVGDEAVSARISKYMLEKDILMFPARYPTVKKGEAILRIGMTELHNEDDTKRLTFELKESFRRWNVKIL